MEFETVKPMDLKVTFRYRYFDTPNEMQVESAIIPIPGNALVDSFEIALYDKDAPKADMPIVGMPFGWHSDSKRYHTICRRIPDVTIDELDV